MVILNTKKHSIDFIYSLVAIDLKGYFGVSRPNGTVEELEVTASLLLRVIIMDRRVSPVEFGMTYLLCCVRLLVRQHCYGREGGCRPHCSVRNEFYRLASLPIDYFPIKMTIKCGQSHPQPVRPLP